MTRQNALSAANAAYKAAWDAWDAAYIAYGFDTADDALRDAVRAAEDDYRAAYDEVARRKKEMEYTDMGMTNNINEITKKEAQQ